MRSQILPRFVCRRCYFSCVPICQNRGGQRTEIYAKFALQVYQKQKKFTRLSTLEFSNCIWNKGLRFLTGWTPPSKTASIIICFGHRGTKTGGNKSPETVFVLCVVADDPNLRHYFCF